jgi:hypothetical protein
MKEATVRLAYPFERFVEGCGGVVGRWRLSGMFFTQPEAGQRSPRLVCGIRTVCGAGR